jgi:amino acid adenylation domain-containing protein
MPHAEAEALALSVHDAFTARARARPDAVAVQLGPDKLTYAELDSRSDALASRLLACGVLPQEPVAIFCERSIEQIVALLGTLKAGGAYLTLDGQDPPHRLAAIFEQARPRCVLTQRRLIQQLPASGSQVICLEDWRDAGGREDRPAGAVAGPDQLAYICFTSGSTGTPKGVRVPHRAVLRLAHPGACWEFTPADSFLQVAPLAFDASVFEIWACLLNGARLVLYPPEPPTADGMAALITEENITVMLLATGLFHRLVDSALPAMQGMRHVLTGGDMLSPDHANRFLRALPHVRLTNGYGVAESTSLSCCYDIGQALERDQAVAIGRPIPGTRAYVLGEAGQQTRAGERGELYLAGDGLGQGYLGQPELTAQRFLRDPYDPDPQARMYRTGDRASVRADGILLLHGRTDAQVKIRGFRVELGEVETALAAHPSVRQAIAVIAGQGTDLLDRQLVAYVTAAAAPGLIAELREVARDRLPDYMVPSVIVRLDQFPLTGNGKVDRSALPEPPRRRGREAISPYLAPRTPAEYLITELVENLLGIDEVSADDDFFEIGGNSLLAADLAAAAQRAFGLADVPQRVFTSWTVSDLAAAISQLRPAAAQAPPPAALSQAGDGSQ